MTVAANVIEKVNLQLGTSGQPYILLANGQWADTGCMAWPMPSSLTGAGEIVAKYNELVMRYLDFGRAGQHQEA